MLKILHHSKSLVPADKDTRWGVLLDVETISSASKNSKIALNRHGKIQLQVSDLLTIKLDGGKIFLSLF